MHKIPTNTAATICAHQNLEQPAGRTIEATCAHYGWTRTFVFERLGNGDLDGLKAGRRTVIITESADRLFRKLPRAGYRKARDQVAA